MSGKRKLISTSVLILLTVTSIGLIVYSRPIDEGEPIETLQSMSNFRIVHEPSPVVQQSFGSSYAAEPTTVTEELSDVSPVIESFTPITSISAGSANPFAPQIIQRGAMEIMTDDYADDGLETNLIMAETTVHNVQSLGMFELTAYCLCIICTEHYSYQHPRNASNPNFTQRTASGTAPRAGRTVAVDPRVIPWGSRLLINGQTYIAEDRGGAIQGRIIDIFKSDHQTAWNFGRREAEIFLIIE